MDTSLLHRIGVISDTHIPHFKHLPQAIWEHFADVELIIHAGDLSILRVIDELETIAPVVAVQGNVEQEEVILKLPIKREIMVGDCRIGIVHILGDSHNRVKVARQQFTMRAWLCLGIVIFRGMRMWMGSCCLILGARRIAGGSRGAVWGCWRWRMRRRG